MKRQTIRNTLYMEPSEYILILVEKYGCYWINMEPSGSKWIYLEPRK